MNGRKLIAVVALVVALCTLGSTSALAGHPTPDPPLIIADATKQPFIDLYLAGFPNQAMHVYEEMDAGVQSLAAVTLDPGGHRVLLHAERWRCDRRNRRFIASFWDGGPPVASFGVRTPSCRRRLSLGMARRARRGAQVRVVVRDRWRLGDLRLRHCVDAPGPGGRSCRPLTLARDRHSVSTRFRAGRSGRWRTALHGPGIRIPGQIDVGKSQQRRAGAAREAKVLVAGDSMMQGLDGFLSDRLGNRAQVFRDVVPASGVSKPGGINWVTRAQTRARRIKPDATVVFLGANEGFDMRNPSGQIFSCCSGGWLAEYTRRVRTMMQAYSRPARGKVFWLQMPQVRYPERHQLQLDVNAAIRRAAEGLSGVRVLRLDRIFTPGDRYRDFMTYRGRRTRVRAGDGIHLTLAGARIAADQVYAALRSARVIR